jgi:CRISPR system Cascade subunit CasC
MLGTVGFDSACYYRYTLLDFAQLTKNLHNDVETALESLKVYLQAFIEAIPNAKQNSFASGNLPFLVFAVVRSAGTPSSLVNAFAKPVRVRQRDGDLLTESTKALVQHAGRLQECYDLYEGTKCFSFLSLDENIEALPGEDVGKMKSLIEKTLDATKSFVEA